MVRDKHMYQDQTQRPLALRCCRGQRAQGCMTLLHRRIALVLAAALAVVPVLSVAQQPPTVEEVLNLHQSWLDSTDNFLAAVSIRDSISGPIVAMGQLLVDHITGAHFFRLAVPPPVSPLVAFASGVGRSASFSIEKIGFANFVLPPGPFSGVSYNLFSSGSTTDETLSRLQLIASTVSAELGTGQQSGLVGLVIPLDSTFKSDFLQSLHATLVDADKISQATLENLAGLQLWFDASDGRLLQLIVLTTPRESFLTFAYMEVNLSPQEFETVRQTLQSDTAGLPRFDSLLSLVEAFIRALPVPALPRWGLVVFMVLMLLLMRHILRRHMRDASST
jgi:hypothetical protein